jgi:hypothetical protein
MPLRNIIGPSRATVRRAVPVALAAASMLAASLAAAPVAGAHTSPAGRTAAAVAGSTAKVMSQQATLAYWTRARLRAAKPADIALTGKPRVRPASVHPVRIGKPGSVPGAFPGGRAAAADLWAAAVSPAYTYPYPYDSFTPNQKSWKTYPYDVNGKLFFTNDGTNYVCSGSSVASASGTTDENEVWTAGHCLVNTEENDQGVDTSAVFIPAYNGNAAKKKYYAPFGEFTWNGGWETSGPWYNSRDLTEDEAAMTVDNSDRFKKDTLGDTVGYEGFAWNEAVDEQFVAFGYPEAAPYNGLNLIEDIASTAGQDAISGGADPTEPIVIGNPMTGGASGGAWDIDWTDTGPGDINGHNDYFYGSEPLALYSPYQDTTSNDVRCFGATTC